MKLKSIAIYLIGCMFMLSAFSCNAGSSEAPPSAGITPKPGIDVQGDEFIEITVPAGWNSFKTTDPVSLMILNVSNRQIISREDFRCKIYVLNSNKWIEVDNKIVYAGNQIILEPNKELDPAKIVGLFVAPDLPDVSKPYQVRIYVFGSMINSDKTEDNVIDYVDVKLSP